MITKNIYNIYNVYNRSVWVKFVKLCCEATPRVQIYEKN